MSNDIRNCSIFIPSDTVYNGKEQKQKVQVMDGTRSMLTEGTDYELSYIDETPAGATSDITDVGTVTVTVTGKGKYTGSNFVTYDITPAPLKVETETASKEYDGSPLTANEGSVTGLVNDEKAALVTTGSQTEPGKSDNTYTIKWAGQSDPDLTAKEQNYQITKESLGVLTVGKYESEITLTSPGKIAVKSDSGEAVKAEWTVSAKNSDTPVMTYEQDHGAAVCKYAVKQDDGSYEDIEGAPTEKGYYRITVTAPSTDHYTASELTSYFRVIEMQDTTLSISAESKVYDGEPMPGLWILLLITCSILLAVLVKLHKANIKDRKRS